MACLVHSVQSTGLKPCWVSLSGHSQPPLTKLPLSHLPQTQGSEAPLHHGTIQQLHLHDPVGVEPPIEELPGEHEPHPLSPTAAAAAAAAAAFGGDAEAVASPPARQTSGGHRGSYEPHHDFQSETYRMVQGSEAPAHHGTIQQLHLHDPMGVEPPIKELPGEHEPHPISPTAAAASLAKVNLEAAFSAASREESGSPKTPPPQAQHPLVSDSA